jgi:Cytosine/adenosine deaminases
MKKINPTEEQKKFMQAAIDLAIENINAGQGGPFGAVVVKNGTIVGRGVNHVTYDNDPTAHAEVVAIRDACKNLGTFQLYGCDIYASCEPCPMCLGAIYWARPQRLFFACTRQDAADAGFDDSYIYCQMALPILNRDIFTVNLMRDKSLEIFSIWNGQNNKIEY